MPSWSVPRQLLEEGIRLCLDKAKALADDAMRLLEQGGSVEHVGVLYVYAVEEYGKALLLNDEAQANAEAATFALDEEIFHGLSAHIRKLARAHRELPPECLELTGEGAFDFRAFRRDAFQVGTPADLATRTESLYIDWDPERKNWKKLPPIKKERLHHAIELLQTQLSNTKIPAGGY